MTRSALKASPIFQFVRPMILSGMLASFGFASSALGATYFFKMSDMVTVWTSDYTSDGTYFIWESRNIKYRLKMCRDQFGKRGSVIEHARFKNDPYVNASSFAIVSEGQIFPFPMPTYQNGSPQIPAGEHDSMIPQSYNELTWKDVSTSGEMEIEAIWTTLDGVPKQKKLSGRDEISQFYNKLAELIRTLPASATPQFIDLFPGELILLTKGNIRVMHNDLEKLIKAWVAKGGNQASSVESSPSQNPSDAVTESSPESFVANGPQGEASFDFTKNGGVFTIKNGVDSFQTKWARRSMYQVNAAAGMAGKIGGKSGLTTLPTLSAAKLMDYSKPTLVVAEGEVVLFRNVHGKYMAVKLMHIDDAVHGGSRDRLTIRWKILQQ